MKGLFTFIFSFLFVIYICHLGSLSAMRSVYFCRAVCTQNSAKSWTSGTAVEHEGLRRSLRSVTHPTVIGWK